MLVEGAGAGSRLLGCFLCFALGGGRIPVCECVNFKLVAFSGSVSESLNFVKEVVVFFV